MNKKMLSGLFLLWLFHPKFCFTQDESQLVNWQLKGAASGMPGTGVDAVHEKLKNKPVYEVIVAVIDGGVDIQHEDLKQNIWINKKEIAGNGVDDDKNGYVDDIYGWNFLGNKSGENVQYDTYESTRTVARLRKKYKDVNVQNLSKNERIAYDKFLEMDKDLELKKKNAEDQWKELKRNEGLLIQVMDAVEKELAGSPLSKENLSKVDTAKNMYVNIGVKILDQILTEQPFISSFDQIKESIKQEYSVPRTELEGKFLYQYNPDFDSRKIVGDNYENTEERHYGNNDVKGPDAFHGTHVAGIIGAVRDNGLGMDGVAGQVKIMALRAVPDGDEHDKDVANAIRYAVDNGAKVINMSFGKGESPYKKAVDEAILYAEKHDVLLVHAAGNAAEDNDATLHFPVKTLDRKCLFCKKQVKNWLDVGALSFTNDADMIASFSNFGKKSVDIFSPGVRIYSTAPENKYEFADGTSMASPVMAGVAALIRSYYPKLSAKQVRQALLESGTQSTKKILKPGTDQMVTLKELCNTGSYVNAVKAMEFAGKLKGSKNYNPPLIKPKA